MRSLGSMAALKGLGHGTGGVSPPSGYVFLRGKNADGSYTIVSGLNADASRSNLAGKAP